ncbi:MAG: hypothetical protein IJS49_06745 [Paludibacteraceae bacterium]|nr:hypothetical protein [Paludibacteraceae bacterium]
MIAACEQYGLQTPEFHQAEDFRTIIYRKEKVSNPTQKVSNLDEKVSNPTQKVSNLDEKVTNLDEKSNGVRLTAKQQKVLEFCDEMPHTAREIIAMIGVKYHTRTLEQYINKLVYAGRLRPTNAKSHDQTRKYITVHAD